MEAEYSFETSVNFYSTTDVKTATGLLFPDMTPCNVLLLFLSPGYVLPYCRISEDINL
jgi:hypothetical protein